MKGRQSMAAVDELLERKRVVEKEIGVVKRREMSSSQERGCDYGEVAV